MYLKKESLLIVDINKDSKRQKRIQGNVQFEQLMKAIVTFYVENYCSIRREDLLRERIQRKITIFARHGDGEKPDR